MKDCCEDSQRNLRAEKDRLSMILQFSKDWSARQRAYVRLLEINKVLFSYHKNAFGQQKTLTESNHGED